MGCEVAICCRDTGKVRAMCACQDKRLIRIDTTQGEAAATHIMEELARAGKEGGNVFCVQLDLQVKSRVLVLSSRALIRSVGPEECGRVGGKTSHDVAWQAHRLFHQ
jgi:hypothetical protein